MRIPIAGLVVSCLYVASTVAQTGSTAGSSTQQINAQNANNVCRVYFSTPKPGMGQQYEFGRKKHMQFHRDQKDTWTWNTFAVETGDNAGMYVTSSCGHAWKDFDEWEARMGKADTADGATKSESIRPEWPQWFLCISLGHEPRPSEPTSSAHDRGHGLRSSPRSRS